METVNIIPATTKGSTYAKLGKAVWVKTTSGNTYRYLDGNKVSTDVFNDAVKELSENESFKFGQQSCPSGKIKIWS
jgi:xanthine/CO dehydrogenase XdhC/CoxF family maturation factor